ncbi:hypothetical protein BV20DRAFT_1090033, partial [Pilatotrama ljubarskyi]
FTVLSRIARDILAIPGVSIGNEREWLFSSCHHTVSNARLALTAEFASLTTKEWLKRGLREGLEYLDLFSS